MPPPGAELRAKERPYVVINMVSSLDGRTAVEGKAFSIGGETDRLVMRTLRSKTDAVMTGAGTVRAEKLDLRAPNSDSLCVIISSSGYFPLENVVRGSSRDLLVFTSTTTPLERVREISRHARVETVLPPETPGDHLPLVLKRLRGEYGISTLLVEGGPRLNHSLVTGGYVDEVFTTLAPKLLGGSPENVPGIIQGPQLKPNGAHQLSLISAYTAEDELYLRYALRYPVQ